MKANSVDDTCRPWIARACGEDKDDNDDGSINSNISSSRTTREAETCAQRRLFSKTIKQKSLSSSNKWGSWGLSDDRR